MSTAWQPSAELADLIEAICHDSITAEQAARLEQVVLSDPESLRYYVRYLHMHATLPQVLPTEGRENDANDECRMMNDELRRPEDGTHPSSFILHSLPTSPFVTSESYSTHYPLLTTHSLLFSYLIATVVLGTALMIAWAWKLPVPGQVAVRPGSSPSPMDAGLLPKMEFVGRITGMVDCEWADPHTAVSGPVAVPLGRKYALSSGLMEITYDSGARVILQGPCTYEVESPVGGYLSIGRLTARIEKKDSLSSPARGRGAGGEGGQQDGNCRQSQRALTLTLSQRERGQFEQTLAQGERGPGSRSSFLNPQSYFAVRTPTAVVTDLGTEFGVAVTQDDATETHVFVGAVTMAPAEGDTGGSTRLLRAGSAARIEGKSNHIAVVAFNEKRFVRGIAPRRLQIADQYASMVLSLHPTSYYRMDRSTIESSRLVDSGPGGHDGEIRYDDVCPCFSFVPGRYGDSLRFRGLMGRDYAIVRDHPRSPDGRLTVAAWIWLAAGTSDRWPAIVANWSTFGAGQFHLGLHDAHRDLQASVFDRDGMITIREGESQPVPQECWQHVAFARDANEMRLYRNGKLVASGACNGFRLENPTRCLTLGCNANETGDGESGQFWRGRIDEVVVFDRTLTADEILQLYEGPKEPPIEKNPADGPARKEAPGI